MQVDAHVQVWPEGGGPEGEPALRREFGLQHLHPLAAAVGVQRLVPVAATRAAEETHRLLALADAHPALIDAVIGFADPERGFAAAFDALAGHPRFAGLHFPLRAFAPDWFGRPAVLDALDALAARGLVADILAGPEHLALCTEVLVARPALRAAIGHCGLPPSGPRRQWAYDLAVLATRTRAWCKVSGLVDRAPPHAWTDVAWPAFAHAHAAFGTARLVAGSNWPTLTLAGDYAGWWALLDRLIARAGLGWHEREAVLGANAAALLARPPA